MHTIQEHGIVPEVPELNAVHVSCAWESGMELNTTTCTSASVNV